MLCQECNRRNVNVHIIKVVNGHKTEIELCEQCARAKGELDFSFEPKISLQNLFASFLGESWPARKEMARPVKIQCQTCALTFAQFSQIGKLGCDNCYRAFGDDKLKPLFRRIHGSVQHVGKTPRRLKGSSKIKKDIGEMKKQLQQLIEKEEYENAARIRDEVKKLKKKLAKKEGGETDGGQ